MTKAEGRGVLVLFHLLDVQLRKQGENLSRSLIDGLDDEQAPDVAVAISGAERAVNGEPNLLLETLAARVRKVDVASVGSAVCGERWQSDAMHRCVRPLGHVGVCCEFPLVGDFPEAH